MYELILTTAGAAEIESAWKAGKTVMAAQVALGDGGGRPLGATPDVMAAATTLAREFGRVPFASGDAADQGVTGKAVVDCKNYPDKTLREIGVISQSGTLLFYGAYPETYLPAQTAAGTKEIIMSLTMRLSHAQSVTLELDPHLMIMTQDRADERYLHAGEYNGRYEHFDVLPDTCAAELLSLNAPEVFDKNIVFTFKEVLTDDYTGPINGTCSIGTPQNYTITLCSSTTMEYQNASTVLAADGSFSFPRSWAGAKSFRLTRTQTAGLVTVWENPRCIRSYLMPQDAPDEARRVMKDRTYTYDHAASAIALMTMNHAEMEHFIAGCCAIVGSGGGEGSVPFFVNRLSVQPSSQYFRTGNGAWVAYALAFYLLKYPAGNSAAAVRDKLLQCVSWLEYFHVTDAADIRSGLYTSGEGRYLNGVFQPDFKADWCTAEHNFDLWFLFDLMGRLGFAGYTEKAAALAASVMAKLWSEDEGRFYAGMRTTGPDKAAPLDCASWGGLFVANIDIEKARRCLAYAERFRYATHDALGYTPYHPEYGYPDKKRGVWVEGAAGVALLARRLGDDAMARRIIAGVSALRTRNGYIDSSDYPGNDDMPSWASSCNTAWVMLVCRPAGFWNVYADELKGGYARY